jgi:hypothetical protein
MRIHDPETDGFRRRFGMRPIHDLTDRARLCVGCHVGGTPDPRQGLPERDVNHDLIAAGHPRLAFELAAYLDRMPVHWIERAAPVDFRARAWAVGQIATARASAALLAWRAATATRPWPELSESSCFDCHFQLPTGLRSSRPRPPSKLGRAAWGSWISPGLDMLDGVLADSAEMQSALDDLRRTMAMPAADRKEVEQRATRLQTALDRCRVPGASFALSLLAKLKARPREGRWDEVAQLFLALRALNHPDPAGRGDRSRQGDDIPDTAPLDAPLDAELRVLYRTLIFPENVDSPRGFWLGPRPGTAEPRPR